MSQHHRQMPNPAAHLPPTNVSSEVDWYAASTAAKGRILAPDLARGLMLLLIALANVPWWLYGEPRGLANAHQTGQTGADLAWQLFSLVVIDGRAYPLFAFLFGYGIWQLYSRQSAAGTPWREARRLLQRRHIWMVAFGAVHALLLWMGDVVGVYGLIGLIVTVALLRRSEQVLKIVAWVAAGLVALGAVLGLAFGAIVSSGLVGDPSKFGSEPFPEVAAEPNYFVFMALGILTWLFSTVAQTLTLLVPLSVVLGLLAARRGLLDRPGDHKRALTRIAVVGVAIGWAGGAVTAAQHAGVLFAPEVSVMVLGVTGLSGVAAGVGYAALFGLAAAWIGKRRGVISNAIGAVGKRSLSSYITQSVLFAPLFAAWGFGLGGLLSPLQAASVAMGVWLVTVVIAVLLDRAGKRGPAEALLRRLAYGKRAVAAPSAVR